MTRAGGGGERKGAAWAAGHVQLDAQSKRWGSSAQQVTAVHSHALSSQDG